MTKLPVLALLCSSLLLPLAAHAGDGCDGLPNWQQLKQALANARKDANGGFNLDMWGTVVATDGTVCAVAHTGAKVGDQWLGSRVISAQKANTANAFSLPGLALSTANLYSPTQPGGSLFGLQFSNPVDTQVAYAGSAADFGTAKDPLVGARPAAGPPVRLGSLKPTAAQSPEKPPLPLPTAQRRSTASAAGCCARLPNPVRQSTAR